MANAPAPSRSLLFLLVALTALGEVSTQLIIPGLGAIEHALQAPQGSALMALSAFVAAFGLGQLLFGPLSDRIGRRPVLIGGLALYVVATLAMLLVTDIQQFIAARVLQGLGACAALVLARTVVRDVWKAEAGPALALTMIGMLYAIVVAPIAGGLLIKLLGWRAPIALALVIGSLVLLLALLFFRESNHHLDPRAAHWRTLGGQYLDLLKGRQYRAYAVALACTYGAMFAVIAGSSAVFINLLGFSSLEYGLNFGLIVSMLIVGSTYTRRNIQRLGPQRIVAMGVTMVAVGGVAALAIYLVFGLSVVGLDIPIALVTLGGGLVLPGSVTGAVMPNAHRAGLAAGLMGFAQMFGATCSGLLLSQLRDGSAAPMIIIQAGLALSALVAFQLLRQRQVKTLSYI
ncbi:MAG: MFS transporter [Pseudomonadales bacterium RIFCSPLOWO2_12_60_38]|jgi:DHA1 family bicyclomycin/chloramphenicol resistance-like MFS transporter|uniref:Bcr/CflA family efflux transporter n=1 Tax=Pseudomonas paracarnis TaxID=2750625 RepID=A0ABU6BT99_9PSED|nr:MULTISPECIES: multidrug effflux MFS transporter [Pseudomonas]AFJ57796.1 drug resistance transporter, Bcr/CflA subfamily [Pseudomonas fluorescens A506]AOS73560.1 MFS transporter [Pseudomonas fluorescens]ETK39660.1 major facilitator transporter [Pseudomonas fluorescens FH5]NLT90080.1 multidrug effflux MFS transporter [Pseudomonas lactis]OHC30857.1 MAG: MFS transporter [Pseudomonadales bacterium RIFCSPLOWO2_12_60_38]OHC39746.1 MAG: MFS transporter [Pseudomonadales bacterium RIFCSPLOWO2_12_FUL